MMFQIGLDLKVCRKRIAGVALPGNSLTTKTLLPFLPGPIGDHAEFARQPHAVDRPGPGCILSFFPFRITAN